MIGFRRLFNASAQSWKDEIIYLRESFANSIAVGNHEHVTLTHFLTVSLKILIGNGVWRRKSVENIIIFLGFSLKF